MSQPLFQTHVIVDWSARAQPSPKRPSADAIWWAVVRDGKAEEPVYARTRADAISRLARLLTEERAAGRRVLVGFDFPFGYPTGVAARLTGVPSAMALWDWISERVADRPDNTNRRFAVAEEINAAYDGVGPCWGRPSGWDYPGVPEKKSARHGTDHPPERRIADARAKGAKTVWQLAYAGSVGSQVLLGLPALKSLREDQRLADDIAVWPFEGGLRVPDAGVVLAEIYPSLLQDEVHAHRTPGETLDAAQTRVNAMAFAALDAEGGLAKLFDGPCDLNDDERIQVCAEEAWILGLGHTDALRTALAAPRKPEAARAAAVDASGGGISGQWTMGRYAYLRSGPEIYAQSFRTVRAEANLARLPEALHPVATRIIHACGMTDVADSLQFSADVAEVARAAMARGAPVLCDCRMVASGVIRRALPEGVAVLTTIDDPATAPLAERLGTTRSAAAVELWGERLAGAVVAIGNAPTALFHLLEMLDRGAPKPAAILAFPVGFVGAAESKDALAADSRGVPFLTLPGRRGGSAMASAAVNGISLGLQGDGT